MHDINAAVGLTIIIGMRDLFKATCHGMYVDLLAVTTQACRINIHGGPKKQLATTKLSKNCVESY